jgi:hypothetical protein
MIKFTRILVISLCISLLLPALLTARGGTEQTESLGDISTLEQISVTVGTGSVIIRGGSEASATSRISPDLAEELGIRVRVSRQGGVATVTLLPGEEAGGSFSIPWNAVLELKLVIPPGIAVSVATGDGRVNLRDVEGRFSVRTGSGSITGRRIRISGPSEFLTGMGNISLQVSEGREFIEAMNAGMGQVELR